MTEFETIFFFFAIAAFLQQELQVIFLSGEL